ncbi:MAG: hypothetical protein ACQESR_17595 [Planctomycetota bacterium]
MESCPTQAVLPLVGLAAETHARPVERREACICSRNSSNQRERANPIRAGARIGSAVRPPWVL